MISNSFNFLQFGAFPDGQTFIQDIINKLGSEVVIQVHNFNNKKDLDKRIMAFDLIEVRHAKYYIQHELPYLENYIKNEVLKHADTFYTLIRRTSEYGSYKLNDTNQLLIRMSQFWCKQIRKNKIKLALFSEIPHRGIDYVLYILCRILGIPVIMTANFGYKDTGTSLVNIVDGIENIGDAFKNYGSIDIDDSEIIEKINKDGHSYLKASLKILCNQGEKINNSN